MVYNCICLSFLIFSLFSFLHCAEDTISFNKIGCLFSDKAVANYEILSFEYQEGYYRAIHASYGIWRNSSVIMKYLGDSTKDTFAHCYLSLNYVETVGNLYHYHIPCTLGKPSSLIEGTYCIEIVGTLIGDIKDKSFCTNSYTFKVIKSTNLPSLSVTGFSNAQQGCVQSGEAITLLAKVSNSISKGTSYGKIGIKLSNTEVVAEDIELDCEIQGEVNINSYDTIYCLIPASVSEGYYTIYYIFNSSSDKACPINLIDNFNSLNFKGTIKKLYIYKFSQYNEIEAKLVNISLNNSLNIENAFTLTFSIDNIQNLILNNLAFEYFNEKDIGIKLYDRIGYKINTKCSFNDLDLNSNVLYFICKPELYEKDIRYSLLIENEILIGNDKGQIVCKYESQELYRKIIIHPNEFDFFIIYNETSSYLDCIQNPWSYNPGITQTKYLCGACPSNCLMCNGNICNKCLNGFSKKNSECELIKENINMNRFMEPLEFFPRYENCDEADRFQDNKQLINFKISYYVNKGENVAFNQVIYVGLILAKSKDNSYNLKCIVDVNPSYIQSEQHYGICLQSRCLLTAYVNCSFQNNVPNAVYEIQALDKNKLGIIINKKIEELEGINIRYASIKISPTIEDDYIQIIYGYYARYVQPIYVCKDEYTDLTGCYLLVNCKIQSYDVNNDETTFKCSKSINEYVTHCQDFHIIMMENPCDEYIKEPFEFRYCPELDSAGTFVKSIFKLLFFFMLLNY